MSDVPDGGAFSVQPGTQGEFTPANFEALLGRVLDPAYGVALRLTGNAADAEDLVQEAALRAFRGFASFVAGTNFKAWFLRILTNRFFTSYRKRQREPVIADDDDGLDLYLYQSAAANGIVLDGANPAGALLQKLEGTEIAAALGRLPEEYRVVAVLYFLEDLRYQDIADVLGIPVGTVRSRLHRGRKLLQKALWELAEDHGIVGELSHLEADA